MIDKSHEARYRSPLDDDAAFIEVGGEVEPLETGVNAPRFPKYATGAEQLVVPELRPAASTEPLARDGEIVETPDGDILSAEQGVNAPRFTDAPLLGVDFHTVPDEEDLSPKPVTSRIIPVVEHPSDDARDQWKVPSPAEREAIRKAFDKLGSSGSPSKRPPHGRST